MQLFRANGIVWDVDDETDESEEMADALAEVLGLPDRAFVYCESEDEIADTLSDRYGWCIHTIQHVEPVTEAMTFKD